MYLKTKNWTLSINSLCKTYWELCLIFFHFHQQHPINTNCCTLNRFVMYFIVTLYLILGIDT